MRAYARGAVAFAALSLSALGATAADSISLSTSTRTSSLPVYEEPRVDWTGFYAGVYGVGQFSSANASQFGLGALAGVSAQFDLVLVGAEVAIHGLDGGAGAPTVYGQMLGLAGLVVNDDVAVYAAAGFGLDLGATTQQDFLLGGGVDLAVADGVSLRAQYLHSFPVQGGNTRDQFTLGATFHF